MKRLALQNKLLNTVFSINFIGGKLYRPKFMWKAVLVKAATLHNLKTMLIFLDSYPDLTREHCRPKAMSMAEYATIVKNSVYFIQLTTFTS